MFKDESINILLGDVGYGIFDDLRLDFPERCMNIGSSEQLMIGMAAGMCLEGARVICYSITPFLLYRPFEFIRNYMNLEEIPIKLVGSGRGQDYTRAGFTHHSDDAEDIFRQFEKIKCYFPENVTEMVESLEHFIYSDEPSFLSLRR